MKQTKNTRIKLSIFQRIDMWLLQTAVILTRIAVFFSGDSKLHNARFARIDELEKLMTTHPETQAGLLLGQARMNHVLSVRPTSSRTELGNLLVVAPTRGGKGLLAVSQLLTWNHSVIVNDIKGDLFTQTAGYRRRLGPVFVLDPTGTGHRFDPLHASESEDEFYSSSSHLLHQANEGEGAIFTQRAVVMLTQMFLAARIEAIAPLPYIRLLMRLGLEAAVSRLNTISPELATQFLD